MTSRQDLNQVFQWLCTRNHSHAAPHTEHTRCLLLVPKGFMQVQLLEVITADVMTLSARFPGEGEAGCAHP